jgi:sulfatase maturation enzyme AslB (radical SAM superfamily)
MRKIIHEALAKGKERYGKCLKTKTQQQWSLTQRNLRNPEEASKQHLGETLVAFYRNNTDCSRGSPCRLSCRYCVKSDKRPKCLRQEKMSSTRACS